MGSRAFPVGGGRFKPMQPDGGEFAGLLGGRFMHWLAEVGWRASFLRHLRLPAGHAENRDGSGREVGRFPAFRQQATRSTDGRNPAWRGDFGQEKGPREFPSPCIWWWNTEPNPRPNSGQDSKVSILRAWIRRFVQLRSAGQAATATTHLYMRVIRIYNLLA
jgi:hypothetical protein